MKIAAERVVITGAQGFLGRYLAADWLAADPRVRIVGVGRSSRLDRHFTHSVHWGEARVRAPLPDSLAQTLQSDRYSYRALDVADTPSFARLIAELRPDIVVHLAAALRDDPAEQLVRANIGTVVSVLEALAGGDGAPPRILFGRIFHQTSKVIL